MLAFVSLKYCDKEKLWFRPNKTNRTHRNKIPLFCGVASKFISDLQYSLSGNTYCEMEVNRPRCILGNQLFATSNLYNSSGIVMIYILCICSPSIINDRHLIVAFIAQQLQHFIDGHIGGNCERYSKVQRTHRQRPPSVKKPLFEHKAALQ